MRVRTIKVLQGRRFTQTGRSDNGRQVLSVFSILTGSNDSVEIGDGNQANIGGLYLRPYPDISWLKESPLPVSSRERVAGLIFSF